MIVTRLRSVAFALALGCAALLLPQAALAQRGDAARAADDSARTAVQTIYQNLIKAGYDWEYIKYEKMPEILLRAVEAVRKQTDRYDRALIAGTFIPTYISSYYDEIQKLDRKHDVKCFDVKFIKITLVPFVQACVREFSGTLTVREIVLPVIEAEYTFKVCGDSGTCSRELGAEMIRAFKTEATELDYGRVCATGS